MKKFLIILIIILSTSMVLASQEMQMELITYWKTNGIEYDENDKGIGVFITKNMNIFVTILKEYDYIYFVFDTDTTTEEVEFFLKTEKLPYSEEFRKDLLKCLKENLNYYNTFGKLPDPRFEWFDDYLVNVFFFVGEGSIHLRID